MYTNITLISQMKFLKIYSDGFYPDINVMEYMN